MSRMECTDDGRYIINKEPIADIILVEQQPHINRRACMIHDLVLSVFSDVPIAHEIHPAKKNTYNPNMGAEETGKMTKRNTKAIAKLLMTED